MHSSCQSLAQSRPACANPAQLVLALRVIQLQEIVDAQLKDSAGGHLQAWQGLASVSQGYIHRRLDGAGNLANARLKTARPAPAASPRCKLQLTLAGDRVPAFPLVLASHAGSWRGPCSG